MARYRQIRKVTDTRIPCPTVYPEVTTHYADGRTETATNVPCRGHLRRCPICQQITYCGYEARCLNDADGEHYVQREFYIEDFLRATGWTQGERWNGWQCPRFEKAEALKVMAQFSAEDLNNGDTLTYDEANDRFVLTQGDYPDEEPEYFDGVEIETAQGEKVVYAIGAWSWTWDAEEEA